MKLNFVKLTVSTALVCAFALTSQAKPEEGERKGPDGERKHRPHMTPEKRAKILERFDANDNGKLDPDERAKAREAWKKKHGGKGPGKKQCPKKGGGDSDDAT